MSELITKEIFFCDMFGLFQVMYLVHENKEDKKWGNIVAIVLSSINGAIIYRHNKNYDADTILKDIPTIFEKYKMYDCELNREKEK